MHYKEYPKLNINYPRFYYVERRGNGSDIDWILKQLAKLNEENRKIACEIYEHLFLKNFNTRKFHEAREEANKFLAQFVNDHGISKDEYEKIIASEKIESRVRELVERCKAAKPVAKTILSMHLENMKKNR